VVQTTGSLPDNERKPRQGLRKSFNVIPPPLPGLTTLCIPNRWLAPPANFRDASGIWEPFDVQLKVHDTL
jgi:hypothetical protein